MIMIGNLIVAGYALYNRADRRVVNAADLWKQVVLNLKIQASNIPAQGLVMLREIRGRLHLT